MIYGSDFLVPKATVITVKALQENRKYGRTDSGEVKTGLADR
jgi:hypothetical protein